MQRETIVNKEQYKDITEPEEKQRETNKQFSERSKEIGEYPKEAKIDNNEAKKINRRIEENNNNTENLIKSMKARKHESMKA